MVHFFISLLYLVIVLLACFANYICVALKEWKKTKTRHDKMKNPTIPLKNVCVISHFIEADFGFTSHRVFICIVYILYQSNFIAVLEQNCLHSGQLKGSTMCLKCWNLFSVCTYTYMCCENVAEELEKQTKENKSK